jgi:hypothetical protein
MRAERIKSHDALWGGVLEGITVMITYHSAVCTPSIFNPVESKGTLLADPESPLRKSIVLLKYKLTSIRATEVLRQKNNTFEV